MLFLYHKLVFFYGHFNLEKFERELTQILKSTRTIFKNLFKDDKPLNIDGDMVFTGVQSVDDRDGQLGPIVASYLDTPCVSVVSGVSVSGGTAVVHKEYSGGMMGEFEVDMPAVLGIQAAKQAPRYAPVSKIRQVQETASIEELSMGDLGSGSGSTIACMAPPAKGSGAEMLDDVEELIEVLKDKGVI